MIFYKKLTFWQNKKRQAVLDDYKKKLREYFRLTNFDPFQHAIIENDKSYAMREWLNKHSDEVQSILLTAGVGPYIDHNDPPAIGGRYRRINLIENFPHLYQFDMGPDLIVDSIDKALGNYEADFQNAIIRTFNPLFWISLLLEWIASIPFRVLGSLGIKNSDKIEDSFFGRLVKLIIKLALGIEATWKFLVFLGVIPGAETPVSLLQKYKFP